MYYDRGIVPLAALGQPWGWSVRDIIFLASAYEGGGQFSPSPSYLPTDRVRSVYCVLIIAELARGAGEAEISNQISALAGIWTPDLSIGSPEH